MEPLKEMFNPPFYKHFAGAFQRVYGKFDAAGFCREVTHDLASLELNQRLRRTSTVLKKYLPSSFSRAVAIMQDAAPLLKTGYTALVLPDFVGCYGVDHFELSMNALRYFTSFGSSEFAVREFIRRDPKRALAFMVDWAGDDNVHVRRLASEGSRPRLPWSFRLDAVIAQPELTAPILEKLKADSQLYVKKSVANHLNDISKDNPGYMLRTVEKWDMQNEHTRWIIRHACRNLIKKGDPQALQLFSFEKTVKVSVLNLRLSAQKLRLGEHLTFSFDVESRKASPQRLVIDYAVSYYRPSEKISKKIFKLKDVELSGRKKITLTKSQQFRNFTTRTHHEGKHVIEIMVNGKKMAEGSFFLKVPPAVVK